MCVQGLCGWRAPEPRKIQVRRPGGARATGTTPAQSGSATLNSEKARPSWLVTRPGLRPLSRPSTPESFTWACAGCDRCAEERGAPPASRARPLRGSPCRARDVRRAPAERLRLVAPIAAAVAAQERPPPLREGGREAGYEPDAVSVAGLRGGHEPAPGADWGCEPRRPLLLRGQRLRPALHGEYDRLPRHPWWVRVPESAGLGPEGRAEAKNHSSPHWGSPDPSGRFPLSRTGRTGPLKAQEAKTFRPLKYLQYRT